jgi:hypothetical protein
VSPGVRVHRLPQGSKAYTDCRKAPRLTVQEIDTDTDANFFLLKKKFIGFGRPMERGGGKDKSLGVDGAVDHVLMSVSLYISV